MTTSAAATSAREQQEEAELKAIPVGNALAARSAIHLPAVEDLTYHRFYSFAKACKNSLVIAFYSHDCIRPQKRPPSFFPRRRAEHCDYERATL
jgi:hypothetical protein